jgi:DNA-binding SARP family transcriptional activator/tetratricopeptide (TPR) repeat protein
LIEGDIFLAGVAGRSASVEFRVLGPVEVWRDGTLLAFPRRQQRLILGILALQVEHVVSSERLIDFIWTNRPPALARAVVQTRISELRSILGASAAAQGAAISLETHGSGYLLRADPDLIDAHRFRGLVMQARAADDDEPARKALRTASQLWRGPALGGWLPGESHAALCHGIESERITALEDLFDIELRLGNHHEVVDEILDAFNNNMVRERLARQVILALHRVSRTPEALRAYEQHRRLVGDELGIDPSERLRDLHLRLLRGDPTLAMRPDHGQATGPSKQSASSTAEWTDADRHPMMAPRMLPVDVPDFTGRVAEIAQLIEMLTSGRPRVAVIAVAGPAGVGKTALCVHVAHALRARFPDGQLYANLHGFDRDDPPTAAEILARFLRALGLNSGLPDGLDERADLYRTLVSDRRILVVVDNAGDAEHVLPLIPASATCAVLVNSRIRLAALVGGDQVDLDVLTEPQAVDLLSRIADQRRVAAEPTQARRLTQLCGGLPLAIRVAAARLVAKPHWSIQRLVDRLSDERKRLDHLAYLQLDVRSSIAMSYAGLADDAKRLLRRLGDIDVPDVNIWCSSALLDVHPAEAEDALEQLHDAHLLDVSGHEGGGYTRYRLHDLVRLFANETATAEEDADELSAARRRGVGAWLSVLEHVGDRVMGKSRNTQLPAQRWHVEPTLLHAVTSTPMRWVEMERHAIIDVVRRAARDPADPACWGLADRASPLLEIGQYFDEWSSALAIARTAAETSGDQLAQATLCFRRGCLVLNRLEHEEATEHFRMSADLYARAGDRHGEARALAYIAMTNRFMGNHDAAQAMFEQALPGLRESADHLSESVGLRNLALIQMTCGDHAQAESYFMAALEAARLCESLRAQAQVLFWQGMLKRDQQRHDEAKQLFLRVLEATRSLGDRGGEAQALRGLGLCHHAVGEPAAAMAVFRQALPLVQQPRPTRIEKLLMDDLAALSYEQQTSPRDQ